MLSSGWGLGSSHEGLQGATGSPGEPGHLGRGTASPQQAQTQAACRGQTQRWSGPCGMRGCPRAGQWVQQLCGSL